MGLFSINYSKAGPGVPKNGPKKKPFFLFWEIFFRKFWKLVPLNIVYFLLCLPIITIGPATAGFTKVIRNFSQEKHAFVWSDFFEAFMKNLKQALPVGIFDVLVTASIVLGFQIYPAMAEQNSFYYVPYVLSISIGIILLIMHFYIYLMIVTVDLPLKNIFKNAFILSCVAIKKNLITLVCVVLVIGGVFALSWYVSMFFLLLYPLIALSLAQMIICFNSYPVIQKYIINPYYEERGEQNPETRYLQPLDEEEVVFTDKGGSEAPIKGQQSRKGKIIS